MQNEGHSRVDGLLILAFFSQRPIMVALSTCENVNKAVGKIFKRR